MSEHSDPTSTNEEFERQLTWARRTRLGDRADLAARDQAVAYLLAHASTAYPRLLSDLRAGVDLLGTVTVIAHFRRAESIPLLVELLVKGADPLKRHVAVALGRHPQPEARTALIQALTSNDREVHLAAISGLGSTQDRGVSPLLREQFGSSDAEIRWLALTALCDVSAVDARELSQIAQSDPDVHVRKLAAQRLQALEGK